MNETPLQLTITEWQDHEKVRQEIISRNRSRWCRGYPALPVPDPLPRPRRVQLYTPGGNCIGTWPYGVDKAEAKAEAIEAGEAVGKVVLI